MAASLVERVYGGHVIASAEDPGGRATGDGTGPTLTLWLILSLEPSTAADADNPGAGIPGAGGG